MKPIESLGYSIYFDQNLAALKTFLKERTYSKVLILVDRNTAEYCLPVLQQNIPELTDYDIIEVDPGEENKNIDFCIGIWKMMIDFGADRNSLLINLGGGVVTDMGGFTASTFKRGFDFIHIPTTLLSQVDASVGGKTGIDMDEVKNIIGTFTQPQAVFISNVFLDTLDHRQKRSGMAEMLKHGLIRDADYFHRLKDMQPDAISAADIRHSIDLKNQVVMEDPEEEGLRKILNFGHTIGHAIEGYSLTQDADPLLHGEAIALGMICEAYLSHRVHSLSKAELDLIVQVFRDQYPDYPLGTEQYPTLLEIMANDKKNHQEQIGFSLLSEIGSASFGHFVSRELILESLEFYRQLTPNGSLR